MERISRSLPDFIKEAKERILNVVNAKKFFAYGRFNMVMIAMFELTHKTDVDFPSTHAIARTINVVLGKKSGSHKGVPPKKRIEKGKGALSDEQVRRAIQSVEGIFIKGNCRQPDTQSLKETVGYCLNEKHTITYPKTAILNAKLIKQIDGFRANLNQVENCLREAAKDWNGLLSNEEILEEDLEDFRKRLNDLITEQYFKYEEGYLIVPKLPIKVNKHPKELHSRRNLESGYMDYLKEKYSKQN